MPDLKRKLGPLPLWQWIAIGAALGLAVAYYRRTHPGGGTAGDALATATPADAEFNPIDPTTGLPIAGGISTGGATDAGAAGAGGSLSDLLANFGALESLLSGLQELQPGPAVDTGPDSVAVQTGTKKKKKHGDQLPHKPKKPPKRKPKPHKPAKKNPGHSIISHGHGKKTASSSAPHNPRQHTHVQAPSHQRHPPTRHASAQHPAARSRPAPVKSTQRHYLRRGR